MKLTLSLRLGLAAALMAALSSCDNPDSRGPAKEGGAPENDAERQSLALPPISHRPLEPLDASASTLVRPLFEKLSAEITGIDFVHRWSPRDQHEALLLKTGFTGGGVCLGDYDRDGRCDIVLTRPHGGARLYRNLGDFRFEDATEKAGIIHPPMLVAGAAFADVDNNGYLDLLLCSYGAGNELFLNDGKGTFRRATGKARPNHLGANVKTVFADYDRDGDLDAFLVTHRYEPRNPPRIRYEGSPGKYTVAKEHDELVGVINLPDRQQFVKAGQYDHLYRNELVETGELAFTDVSTDAGIKGNHHGLDVIWWDFNDDLYPDLYISNDFTDPDQLYRNNGDGTFTDITLESLPHTPWFTMGAAAADFSGDGLFDLLAAEMSATSHYREKMAMGAMDSVAWFLDTAEPRQYMRNALYVGTGTPRFMEAAYLGGLASSDWTWSIKVGDLDNDGREDVYFTNGFTRDYNNADFAERMKGTGKSAAEAWQEAPVLREKNLAFRSSRALHFDNVSADWGIDESGISFGAALGDLDGDGDLDLVTSHFESTPGIYRNRSAKSHRIKIILRGRSGNSYGIGAHVKVVTSTGVQRRYLSPGNGFMSADEPALFFGLGDEKMIDQLSVQWPGGAMQTFENLAADRVYTIAEPAGETPPIPETDQTPVPWFSPSDLLSQARHRETPHDDFAAQPLLPNKLSQLGPSMAWGDVDGDGDDDFFLGGAAGQAGQLFLCGNGGSFAAASAEAVSILAGDNASEDMGCVLFDADADGDADLYVVSGGVECEAGSPLLKDRLYLNTGTGIFTRAPAESLPGVRDSGGPVAAMDFDKDGDVDLFVGGRLVPRAWPTPPASRLLQNEGGVFADVTEEIAPEMIRAGMVTSAVWSDVDGDDWVDLLVTLEYGTIKVFRNEGGRRLRETTTGAGLANLKGWWNSIAGTDIDGDGDIDYAVGNLGWNTKYQPSPEKPQVLFYGDFEGAGQPRIVEAKPGESGLLPIRGRSCSSDAMPFLKEKFESYHSFASASLEQIYTARSLEQSLRLEATTAASGLLINDGQGHFTFKPLPRLGQISPARDLVFLDANVDAHPDLFIAQNSFAPQRETGRMDGDLGLLLIGDGTGAFVPVRPDRSGIIVPHDTAAADARDVNGDGRTDIIAATNDGPMIVLLRNPY